MGLGAVGLAGARHLLSSGRVDELVVFARNPSGAQRRAAQLGSAGAVRVEELSSLVPGGWFGRAAAALFATPWAGEAPREAVRAGLPVVSVADTPSDVRSLLELDTEAKQRGVSVIAGAAMAPGLSCLLAAFAATHLDELTEVHVAVLGTGGPACARSLRAALRGQAEEWRDGGWRKVEGSGRELVWFPVEGGADCYRVSRADPLLLARAFPGLASVSARVGVSRSGRARLWLRVPRGPKPRAGALVVEVRGRRAGRAETVLLGANGDPASVAGAVAAGATELAGERRLRPGAGGLASMVDEPGGLLAWLARRGVKAQLFEGAGPTPTW